MTQTRQNNEFINQDLLTNEALRQLATKINNVSSHKKMLETQFSQVFQQQASTLVPSGSFSGQPEQNPKGHLNDAITRSESVSTPPEKEVVKEVEKEAPYVAPPPFKLVAPFPQRLEKDKVETQFKNFMELLKKIHRNVPFTKVLTQMSSYAKFLKEIISNKRKLEDHEIMAMTLDSSDVI
ncbi:uncharacterized protein LOC127123747 [Lathyrus oleraceus]|uniref:uncharacterized protein LOC127123747 n=1 Tax=Pisum sativum TaxID=3888 RepID=UPI0021CF40FD|nr:uncharacterized protein LOC127123747 [Pisum sativum]